MHAVADSRPAVFAPTVAPHCFRAAKRIHNSHRSDFRRSTMLPASNPCSTSTLPVRSNGYASIRQFLIFHSRLNSQAGVDSLGSPEGPVPLRQPISTWLRQGPLRRYFTVRRRGGTRIKAPSACFHGAAKSSLLLPVLLTTSVNYSVFRNGNHFHGITHERRRSFPF